jgi:oligopeptide/dipeptide ABC transporter ATP-binding protein
MRQRAMIGAALIGEPDLLIADEPTTALDVTVQAQILSLMRELRLESRAALLLITHDLGVVAGNSDRVIVVDKGSVVEEGETAAVFRQPSHDRTKALMAAAPNIASPVMAPEAPERQGPVLEVSGLAVSFEERRSGWGERLTAVNSIDLTVGKGETVAVVGESGSGKTSLVRAVLGLVPADRGTVSFLGETLSPLVNGRPNGIRRHLQMVFQDPIASLNPAMSVAEIIAEPLKIHGKAIGIADNRAEALAMLRRVGLGPELAGRYPHELSGGQAQRVAIARSLVMRPDVLVCDEAVAALDGTVRQGILELLTEEQRESGLSLVFITHDLAVVRQISHRILVMYMGRLCELAGNDALFARPRHPYSKALLRSVPVADPDIRVEEAPLRGETSSMLKPPAGCPFHPRCPHAIGVCSEKVPHATSCDGAVVACHRADELDLSY